MRIGVRCAKATAAPESALESARDGVGSVATSVRDPNYLEQRRVAPIGVTETFRVDRAVHGAATLSRLDRERRLEVYIRVVQLPDALREEQLHAAEPASGPLAIDAQGKLEV